MKNHLTTGVILTGALLALIALAVVGCTTPAATSAPPAAPTSAPPAAATSAPPAAPTAPPEMEGDPVRGGQLYDMWWAVAGEEEEHGHEEEGEHEHEAMGPETDQPLWATQTTNTRSGEDTWRCKECHGWDYMGVDGAYGSGSHMTGFAGIFDARSKPAAELLAILQGSTNPDHDFSTVMDEHDLADLAVFMSQTLIDDSQLVNADKSSKGDAAQGEELYGDVCTHCHGPDGNAINFGNIEEPEFLGHLAPDNPWEFIHKVRYGQPGWPMPSAINNEWTLEDVANVLAYAQTFGTEPSLSGGGPLYDKWWVVIGAEAPEGDQPLWATQTTNTRSGEDTWRCKECHGWDYKGVDGAYGSGSHMTGFKGVLDAVTMSADDLTAWLTGQKNPDHDFSAMGDVYVQALVTFMQEETFDSAAYVSADKTVTGEPARGEVKFEATCAACHGQDGKRMNFGSADEPEYVGTIAADNPWEFLHKASFGHPGVPMPAGRALGWSLEDIVNVLSYAQTLPIE